MNEEIDIIELLQRVKEDKAPKEIEIEGKIYIITLYPCILQQLYVEKDNMSSYWAWWKYTLDTKIKILDKPIIEELDYSLDGLGDVTYNESWLMNCIRANKNKINEVIRHINKEEK